MIHSRTEQFIKCIDISSVQIGSNTRDQYSTENYIYSLRVFGQMFRVVFLDIIPDDGGSTHLLNVGRQSFYTAVYPRRQLWTSYSPPWDLEISHFGQIFDRKITQISTSSISLIICSYLWTYLWQLPVRMCPQLSQRMKIIHLIRHLKQPTAFLESRWQWCVIRGRTVFAIVSLKHTSFNSDSNEVSVVNNVQVISQVSFRWFSCVCRKYTILI
jgi:hypothetical protein